MLYREDSDIMIELLRVVEYIISSVYLSFISRFYTLEKEVLCTYRALEFIQSLVVKMYPIFTSIQELSCYFSNYSLHCSGPVDCFNS